MTTRFPYGITTATKQSNTGFLGFPDPTKWHVYFNDFDTYVVGDWTITTTEAGAGSATEALTAGDGGLLLITNDAADNDADFFQLVAESFLVQANKKLIFKARFKVSDATQSDWIMGVQLTDTTPLDVTDGIYFMKDDGDANIDFYVEADNSTTGTAATAIATNANDTFVVLGFYWNGKDTVEYFVDDVRKGSISVSSSVLAAIDDETLALSFGIQNGEAAAKTMTIDYILVAQER